MPEPITTTTVAIKAGTMIVTGGLIAELVIFNDGFYLILATVGAIVSMFGVLHEVLKNRPMEHTLPQIFIEMFKGLFLGVMAIPFWYLVLSVSGGTLVKKFTGMEIGSVANSVWLMISFSMSWYTVPIFDWVASKVVRRSKDV